MANWNPPVLSEMQGYWFMNDLDTTPSPDEVPDSSNNSNKMVFGAGASPTLTRTTENTVLVDAGQDGIAQAYIQSSGESRIYFGIGGDLYVWVDGEGTLSEGAYDIGPDETVDTEFAWSLLPYGSWLLATKGGKLFIWKNDRDTEATAVTLPDITSARILNKLGPHVILFNTSSDGSHVYWCHEDDPETWLNTSSPDPAKTYGDLTLRDLSSEIISVHKLSDGLAIYTKDEMGILQYIGTPLIFGFQRLVDNIGAWSLTSVIPVGRNHFGWGPQGIWVSDGFESKYIDDPMIRLFLQEDMNLAEADKISGFYDEQQQQVVWYYPQGASTQNTAGLGFNITNGSWTRYAFGRKHAVERSVFDYPLTVGNGTIIFHGDPDGTYQPSWVQSKPLDFGESEIVKRVQKVRMGLEIDESVTVYLGGYDYPEDEITWYYSRTLATSSDRYFFTLEREFAYTIIKVESNGYWKLSSFEFFGEEGGFLV
jgi:hypothetical protein